MNIALSGSNGFIGSELKHYLKNLKDVNLILISRKKMRNQILKMNIALMTIFKKG